MKDKRDIRILKIAEIDIIESAEWYSKQKELLGDEFVDEIDNAIERIENNPNQYERVHTMDS